MNLYLVHRVLLFSAIALGVLFAAHAALRFRATGEALYVVLAGVSVAASGALALYLRWFLRKRAVPASPSTRGR